MDKIFKYLNFCVPADEFFDYPLQFSLPDDLIYNLKKTEPTVLPPQKPPPPKEPTFEEKKFSEIAKGASHISPDLSAIFVRSLGETPSIADILELKHQHGEKISYSIAMSWKKQLNSQYHCADLLPDLKKCFCAIDRTGSGKISAQQLVTLLTNYGDALTDKEVDAVLESFGLTSLDTEINYDLFCSNLLKHDS